MWGLCRTLTCPGSPFALFQGGGPSPALQEHLYWIEALNGREWASIIWVAIAVAWMLSRSDMRPWVFRVIRAPLGKTTVRSGLLMLAWIAAAVFAGSRVDLWEPRLIGATLAWIVASAFAGFFKVLEIPNDRHYFRTAARRAVRITILVDAYVNLYVFPFAIELVLLPLLTLLAMLIAVAEVSDDLKGAEYDTTRGCLKSLLGIIGLGLIIFATIHTIGEISSADGLSHFGKSLILPVWLNLALIPFSYLLAIYLVYQSAFVDLRFPGNATKRSVRRAKRALLVTVGPRPYVLGKFGPPWPYRLNEASTLAEARQVAADLRAERAVAQVSDTEASR